MDMARVPTAWLLLSFILAGTGCQQAPIPLFDPPERSFQPSQMQAGAVDVERLAETKDCLGCHEDVGSHWMSSAHAHASFDNPWYRASVDAFREARGNEASRFCAGCHDPLLLLSGGIDQPVEPGDDLAYAGITCLVCHSIEASRTDGNASYRLTDAAVIIPDPASPSDIEAHRARLAMPALRTAELCGSCHRSFTGPHMGNPNELPGIDDLADWQTSAAGGGVGEQPFSVDTKSCQGCHMQDERTRFGDMAGVDEQRVSSHRWAASHSAMGAQLNDARQETAIAEALRGAILVDLPGVSVGKDRYQTSGQVPLQEGAPMTLELVLENTRTGHRFPGGARDMHDSWVEIEVRDGNGVLLGSSRHSVDERDEDNVFVLRSTLLDAEGSPEPLHRVDRFHAPAFDRTVPAGEARLARYPMILPSKLVEPIRVHAEVLHRKHAPAFQREACRASRTPRGRAFAAGASARGRARLDACRPQPITLVAEATVWLGEGSEKHSAAGGAARPRLERLLSHGRALLQDSSEHSGRARTSLEAALELAAEASDSAGQAEAQLLLSRLATLEGRTELALRHADASEAQLGPHPAIDRARGDAYASTWRWAEAAAAYAQVAAAAPNDWTAWRDLARARGSLGDEQAALRAAEQGLELAPRQEDLLRSRALALRALERPEAAAAQQLWLAHRRPDAQPRLLARCERTQARCAIDRQPVPVYGLRAPATKPFHGQAEAR